MAATLDWVPVERITTEAKQVRFGLLLLRIVAAFFYAVGWVVGKAFLALAWCAVAVKVGFVEAKKGGLGGRPAG